jgi:hypothetical protein
MGTFSLVTSNVEKIKTVQYMQSFLTNQFPFGAINLTVISLSVTFSSQKAYVICSKILKTHTGGKVRTKYFTPRGTRTKTMHKKWSSITEFYWTNFERCGILLQSNSVMASWKGRNILFRCERCSYNRGLWLTVRNELVPQNICCYRRSVA